MLRFDRVFPYAMPPLLTILACLFLALLTIKSGRNNRENKLFTLLSLMLLLYNVNFLLYILMTSQSDTVNLTRWSFVFFVFSLPVSIQFIHQMLGLHNRKWIEWGLYGFCFVSLPWITLTDFYFTEGFEYYFGMYPRANTGLYLFAVMSILGGIYYLFLLGKNWRAETDPNLRRKMLYILIGFPSGWLMIGFNMIPYSGIELYPPGAFAFIPLSLMVYGVLRHALLDTSESFLKKGYLGKWLSYVTLLPLLAAGLFLEMSESLNITEDRSLAEVLWPFGFPPLLSAIVCLGLAAWCLRKGIRQLNTILLGIICLLWGLLSFSRVLIFLVSVGNPALQYQIANTAHFFFVNQLGVYLHFIHRISHRPERKLVIFYYICGTILMFLPQANLYFNSTLYHYYYGVYLSGSWGFAIVGLLGFFGLLRGGYLLLSAQQQETNPRKKRNLHYLFIGLILTGILNLFTFPALQGIEFYPLGDFTFIPIGILAYGILVHDVLHINVSSKKRFSFVLVKFLVIAINVGVFMAGSWALQDYSWAQITSRLSWSSLPQSLSWLCCLFLSWISLRMAQNQKAAQLFSLLCCLFGLINADIFLNSIIDDPVIGLRLTRWEQPLFVFVMALIPHMTYLITKKETGWRLVYLAYGVCIVYIPITQTDYYFRTMQMHFWGMFPRNGFFFDVFALLIVLSASYSAYLLSVTWRETRNPIFKNTVTHLLLGFMGIALLTLGDMPAIYGYDVYPIGSFSFIPLTVLAYGLFKHSLKELVQNLRGVLFWGVVGLAMGFLLFFNRELFDFLPEQMALMAVTVTALMAFPIITKSWQTVLDLFICNQAEELRQLFYSLTENLSHVHRLQEIHQQISGALMENLECSRSEILFYSREDKKLMGWQRWNKRSSVFEDKIQENIEDKTAFMEPYYPFLSIFNVENTLIALEDMESWVLEQHLPPTVTEKILNTELTLAVFFQDRLTALILLDQKINGIPYSRNDKDFLQQLGLVLGPHIEHAKLLQGLERQVAQRTRDLTRSNEIAGNQNRIFQSLLQTSATMHQMNELEEFFQYTLNQLRQLFTDSGFAIILHGERPEIVEMATFDGIEELEQDYLLQHAGRLLGDDRHDFIQTMRSSHAASAAERIRDLTHGHHWTLLPLRGREQNLSGNLIVKGPQLDNGSLRTITLFLEQVTAVAENKILTRQLEKIANTDGLTGVYNRLYFDREMNRLIQQNRQFSNIHFSVILIDVNGLKRVNDVYGHQDGDAMIVTVADLLVQVCRKSDIVVRLGGDEFVVVCPASGYEQVQILVERIREAEQQSTLTCKNAEGHEDIIPIRMSLGVACTEDTPADAVLKKADQRMYADKEAFYANQNRYR
ncbi:MAG: diguanylate cyclase [SAR324 cluster bacterium]|nr:diguanylate cyclase [SAR324 cluster bacterium]